MASFCFAMFAASALTLSAHVLAVSLALVLKSSQLLVLAVT